MKKFNSILIITLIASASFAFDWPQNEIMSDTFSVYFGQPRGELLSTSLVFSGSEEIKAAEKGQVTCVLSEHDEDDLFESTLGNAVIIAHEDNMLTVYANLSSEEQNMRYELKSVESGTPLGSCGNSGWQEGNSLLEFQVVDIGAKTYVNPRILMPRFGNETPLFIRNVSALNSKGQNFDLNTQKHLQSGTYKLYMDRQLNATPYKSTVLINGAAVDSITYDTLIQQKGRISTSGKKSYTSKQVYPNLKRQLLAEVTVPKGHNKITIIVADILGKEKSLTYTIDAF